MVVDARNGDGANDPVSAASDFPYITIAAKVVPVSGLPAESNTGERPLLLRLIWPCARAETAQSNQARIEVRWTIMTEEWMRIKLTGRNSSEKRAIEETPPALASHPD